MLSVFKLKEFVQNCSFYMQIAIMHIFKAFYQVVFVKLISSKR